MIMKRTMQMHRNCKFFYIYSSSSRLSFKNNQSEAFLLLLGVNSCRVDKNECCIFLTVQLKHGGTAQGEVTQPLSQHKLLAIATFIRLSVASPWQSFWTAELSKEKITQPPSQHQLLAHARCQLLPGWLDWALHLPDSPAERRNCQWRKSRNLSPTKNSHLLSRTLVVGIYHSRRELVVVSWPESKPSSSGLSISTFIVTKLACLASPTLHGATPAPRCSLAITFAAPGARRPCKQLRSKPQVNTRPL